MNTSEVAGHTHCIRCGRKLTARVSVARQMGRGCRAIVRAAALAEALKGFTQAQADKARELIADGGIVAIREGIYRVAASNGSDFYSVAVTGQCSCRAGVNGKACYHFAAARVMAASVAR
jgi:hypothetical protein